MPISTSACEHAAMVLQISLKGSLSADNIERLKKYLSAHYRLVVSTDDLVKEWSRRNNPFDRLDENLKKGIAGYIPANNVINASLAFPQLRLALGIDHMERRMNDVFNDNHYNPDKGYKSASIGEGLAARLLYLVDSDMAAWGTLPEALRIELIANARKNDFAQCGKEATPDFIFLEQITDVFTNHISLKRNPDPLKTAYAIIAQNGALMNNAIDKWRMYGRHSIAVANITSFPEEISTTQVANAVLLDQDWRTRHVTNRLFLVRHKTITEVTANFDLD